MSELKNEKGVWSGGLFWVGVALLVWGLEVVLRKPLLGDISAWGVTAITVWVTAMGTLLVWPRVLKEGMKPLQAHWKGLIGVNLLGLGGFGAFYTGLHLMDASVMTFVKKIEPLFVLVYVGIFFGTWVPRHVWLWVIGALGGMALVAGVGTLAWADLSVVGIVMALLASALWAGTTVTAKWMLSRGLDAVEFTFWRFLVGSVMLLPFSFVPGFWGLTGAEPAGTIGWIVGTGVLTFFGFVAYYQGLQEVEASDVAVLELLSPLIVIGLGAVLLGERLIGWQWAGALIILVCVWKITHRQMQPGEKTTSE